MNKIDVGLLKEIKKIKGKRNLDFKMDFGLVAVRVPYSLN